MQPPAAGAGTRADEGEAAGDTEAAGTGWPGAPLGSPPALSGRRGELAAVRALLDRAAGHGGALVLTGQAGVGKSALVSSAVAAARRRGLRVLPSTAVEWESDLPFAALDHWLTPLEDEAGGLDEAHSAALAAVRAAGDSPAPDVEALADRLVALLAAAAGPAAPLLAVDDAHWLDALSAAVLSAVLRRAPAGRIGVLVALRPDGAGHLDVTGVPLVEVAPLAPPAARALLGRRFPALAPWVAHRLLQEAQGNPLVLLGASESLSVEQRSGLQDLPVALPLPRRLLGIFAARVERLPPQTRELLLLLALAGTRSAAHVVQAAAARLRIEDLHPAERSGLVALDAEAGTVGFCHPLVRPTVLATSTSSQRHQAHRVLAEHAGDPARRAWHLAHATLGPDDAVAQLLEHAADALLEDGNVVGAARTLVQAARLSRRSPDRSRRLARAAYLDAGVTGALDGAAGLLLQARREDPQASDTLYVAIGEARLLLDARGDVESAHRALASRLREHDDGDEARRPDVVEALYTLFDVCLYGLRPDLWTAYDAGVARLGREPPGDLRLLGVLRDPGRATTPDLHLLDTAIDALARDPDPGRAQRVAAAAMAVDRPGPWRDQLARAMDEGRSGTAVGASITALTLLCVDAFATGRWDECGDLCEEGVARATAHGYELHAAQVRVVQALLAAARGGPDRVRQLTAQVDRWAAPRGVGLLRSSCRLARGLSALGSGDDEAAFAHACAVSPPGVLAPGGPQVLWAALDLVESAVRTGRLDAARAHVDAMVEAGLPVVSARMRAVVAGSRAMTAAGGPALDLFEEALASPEGEQWPFDRARIRLAYGERLRRGRRATQARAQLAAALTTFRRLGADPWADRATRELVAAGVGRPRPAGRGSRSLTPQEREVALLVTSGLTNKAVARQLQLSHRTVGAHLRSAFTKLGIRSRAALGVALDDLDDLDDLDVLDVLDDLDVLGALPSVDA